MDWSKDACLVCFELSIKRLQSIQCYGGKPIETNDPSYLRSKEVSVRVEVLSQFSLSGTIKLSAYTGFQKMFLL